MNRVRLNVFCRMNLDCGNILFNVWMRTCGYSINVVPTICTSPLQAFYDFRMRRSLARVHKIRQDRAALPIAKYRDAILAAVASNRCVLIAGDTGCGKSTQVIASRSPWGTRWSVFASCDGNAPAHVLVELG